MVIERCKTQTALRVSFSGRKSNISTLQCMFTLGYTAWTDNHHFTRSPRRDIVVYSTIVLLARCAQSCKHAGLCSAHHVKANQSNTASASPVGSAYTALSQIVVDTTRTTFPEVHRLCCKAYVTCSYRDGTVLWLYIIQRWCTGVNMGVGTGTVLNCFTLIIMSECESQ